MYISITEKKSREM